MKHTKKKQGEGQEDLFQGKAKRGCILEEGLLFKLM